MLPLLLALFASSPLIITEVMANPKGTSEAHGPEDRNEFVEIYNAGTESIDLYDWVIDDGDSPDRLVAWANPALLDSNPTVIINYTWLAPGRYAVVLDSEYLDPNPVGGYVRPYRFGDSTLILTTRNTTIGNGLAAADPLSLISPYGDTASTFGTPADTTDSLPRDAGDGFSWERIHSDRPDAAPNWMVSVDSSGSTPGRANSVSSIIDLAVTGLAIELGAQLEPGRPLVCSVLVANRGTVVTEDWRLIVWLDANGNKMPDPTEVIAVFPGLPVAPDSSMSRACRLVCPEVTTELWARVEAPADRDTSDNSCRLNVTPGGGHLLSLGLSSFSPNGDGREDSLPIFCRLPGSGGKLAVTVFNLAGRRCRSVFTGDAPGSSCRLDWNGRDDAGRTLPTGIYVVLLEYRLHGSTFTDKLPVVLERE